MKKINGFLPIIIVFSMILFFTNCKKDTSNSSNTIQNVIGYAQKGPFINGSSVTVYDLQSNLSPTGKSFNAQIIDNKGTFKLSDILLSSNYVSLRADGFYFNEISGQQSAAQITLYALSDVTGKSDININLLTHLEKSRVEYLIKNGKSFSDSKAQAQKEILAIFNIQKSDIKISESLNIAESGDDNGILLAISSILQGFRSESELTELLSNISQDISTDGILSSDTLGSALINHAVYLDTVSIKNNLAQRYAAIGSQSNIPDFGKYIANFISQTKFKVTNSLITYPSQGVNGVNILALSDTLYSGGSSTTTFSLAAQIPKSVSLKIKITSLSSSSTSTPPLDTGKIDTTTNRPMWYYSVGSAINWSITLFDEKNYTQTFTAIESGKSCDLLMYFDKGSFLIEYYEMNPSSPTRKKTITVK
jgi:hypothetical protein